MSLNKINPNPKPRFPKGKTHKDMRIVRPIDLDPIVDAINENSDNIDNITESFIPFAGGGLVTGNILVDQGVGIVNENENYGVLHGLTSPVSTNKFLLLGDLSLVPPTTGTTSQMILGGTQLGLTPDIFHVYSDYDNDLQTYLSLGTNGGTLRQNETNNEYTNKIEVRETINILSEVDAGSPNGGINIKSSDSDGYYGRLNAFADHSEVQTVNPAGDYSQVYLTADTALLIASQNGVGSSAIEVKYNRTYFTGDNIQMPNLPTYADNAAATGAGLTTDQVYKTATGELRIVV